MIVGPYDGEEGAQSRRKFLEKSALGFGAMALKVLLERECLGQERNANQAPGPPIYPLAPKPPHFPAKAQRVILIFLQGGPSHVDTFDPKPELTRLDGQPLPASFHSSGLNLQFVKASETRLMASRLPFKRRGQSGLEISGIFEE